MLDELFIRGGPVLYLLFGLTFLIFLLLIDKYIFVFIQSKLWVNKKFSSFMKINPPASTKYKFVESTLISNVKRKTASNIKILDGLIGMCPMIGLLGTVYGMIEVFEVLSFMALVILELCHQVLLKQQYQRWQVWLYLVLAYISGKI